MPRLNNGTELYKYLNTCTKIIAQTTTPGSTTTTAPLAQGASVVAITASTNFTSGDLVFIVGSGGTEILTIGTPNVSMPIVPPNLTAQATGALFYEAVGFSINHIAEAGVTFGGSQTSTDILAATSRTAINTFVGAASLTFSIPLLGHNNLNLQSVFGATEGEIGSGVAATPWQVLIDGSTVSTQANHCYRLAGVDAGGRNIQIDLLGCTTTVNTNITVGAPNPGGMTVTGKCTAFAQRIW